MCLQNALSYRVRNSKRITLKYVIYAKKEMDDLIHYSIELLYILILIQAMTTSSLRELIKMYMLRFRNISYMVKTNTKYLVKTQ